MNVNKEILSELKTSKESGLYRKLKTVNPISSKYAVIRGKEYLNFSSNDYLGLSHNKELIKKAFLKTAKLGSGGASSRLVSGTFEIHKELEDKLASFKNKERALVFPSGYQTNLGVISTLIKDGDCIIMDKLNHASLWDAAKLSRARVFVYAHRDMNILEKVLKRTIGYKRRLVVSDSVFSMDGDIAPLRDIVCLAKKYGALTMIDEAHATGIFGARGRGIAELHGVEEDIDIIMGTMSKAFAGQGGFVCSSKTIIDYLVNKSRPFIYTTSLLPFACAVTLEALEIIDKSQKPRVNLLKNALYFSKKINEMGYSTLNSESQIVPLVLGSIDKTKKASDMLFSNNVFVPAIRPPTVPKGTSRLRFSLNAEMTGDDIDKVLRVIEGLNV